MLDEHAPLRHGGKAAKNGRSEGTSSGEETQTEAVKAKIPSQNCAHRVTTRGREWLPRESHEAVGKIRRRGFAERRRRAARKDDDYLEATLASSSNMARRLPM